uniref:Ribosome-binding factor A n=1 Tax=Rhizophagus irregularis (strain DAOM 181602 / DAOM 197198 / MUCL 43194) TaxID=747089 RepID=U9TIA9_RHIID
MRTFINNQNHTLFKKILKPRSIIISRFLTIKSINQNDKDISSQTEDEYNEILKHIKFLKNGRQLKKESQFGDEAITKISARKLRSGHTVTDVKESNNEDNVDSLLSFKGFSRAQQNIAQRLSRAIIKCNDDVPHNHLTSTFVRIMNIDVSPELNFARVWWKPDPQKGINKSKIDNTMNKYSTKYRNILQRAMHMRNPPKIIFLRYDEALGNINELLDKIEEELKVKDNEVDN